ncbi:hypothetical protein MIR68_000206 [Amoeboaphelidium protococcarum]|nr:hypothetical protein MIR68_000206 [Amoeboaphelidium protococcarum]
MSSRYQNKMVKDVQGRPFDTTPTRVNNNNAESEAVSSARSSNQSQVRVKSKDTKQVRLRQKSTTAEQSLLSPETPTTSSRDRHASHNDDDYYDLDWPHPQGSQRGVDKVHTTSSPRVSDAELEIRKKFYSQCAEFIPGRLYFTAMSQQPDNVPSDAYLFSVDHEFVYSPFYSDFGPLNISCIVKFGRLMDQKLKDPYLQDMRLVLITSPSAEKCSNISLLITSYMVLNQDMVPELAYQKLTSLPSVKLMPFRDAGYGSATYWINNLDILRALEKGVKIHQLIDLDSFPVEEYDFYERVENGDWNWIIPDFFLALATPHDKPLPHLMRYHEDVAAGRVIPLRPVNRRYHPMINLDYIVRYYRENNVKGLIRLNNPLYDRQRVIDGGVSHYELFFPDGSVPSDEIVRQFLEICDQTLPYNLLKHPYAGPLYGSSQKAYHAGLRGSLAIHCKAGLGRTGSLICCWMIRTLGWTAKDCISWIRVMRPGSVVGPQQNWLESMEQKLKALGRQEAARYNTKSSLTNLALSANSGYETVAKTTNSGMQVPLQPRKLERDTQFNNNLGVPLKSASLSSSTEVRNMSASSLVAHDVQGLRITRSGNSGGNKQGQDDVRRVSAGSSALKRKVSLNASKQ